jgi:hypothetical protein
VTGARRWRLRARRAAGRTRGGGPASTARASSTRGNRKQMVLAYRQMAEAQSKMSNRSENRFFLR